MKYLSYVVVGIVAYAVYDVLLKGVMQEGMENGSGIKELVFDGNEWMWTLQKHARRMG